MVSEDKTDKELKRLIIQLLKNAIVRLYQVDMHIIRNKVSERCVCARLAYHLECLLKRKDYCKFFQGYYVDVEYDRMGSDPKLIGNSIKRHVCDLLIHSRGCKERDNLLALEMKVHNNYSKLKFDYLRLSNIVQHRNERNKDFVCETLLGVFLRIQKNQYSIRIFDVDVCNGKPSEKEVYKIQS